MIKYASLCKDQNGFYMDMELYNTPEEAEQTSDFVKVIKIELTNAELNLLQPDLPNEI